MALTSCDFRVYLHPTIVWNPRFGQLYSLVNRYTINHVSTGLLSVMRYVPLSNDCVVLHAARESAPRSWKKSVGADILAHTHHSVDFLYAKPVEDVWHQCLKSHVLHSCHIFGPLEVFGCSIGTTLSGIVNEIL